MSETTTEVVAPETMPDYTQPNLETIADKMMEFAATEGAINFLENRGDFVKWINDEIQKAREVGYDEGYADGYSEGESDAEASGE